MSPMFYRAELSSGEIATPATTKRQGALLNGTAAFHSFRRSSQLGQFTRFVPNMRSIARATGFAPSSTKSPRPSIPLSPAGRVFLGGIKRGEAGCWVGEIPIFNLSVGVSDVAGVPDVADEE